MSGSRQTLRVAMVAGEASGDLLGAGLIRSLRARFPSAHIEGIAGPHMQAEGAQSLYPMERLSVMGLVEAIGRYRELLPMRARLLRRWIDRKPDVLIGIDAPDFNLGLERKAKAAGIPTVHYVSPSVWAWRTYRLPKIARSVDLMLTLFPFEADFYRRARIPVAFVGHPLADEIPLEVSQAEARRALSIEAGPTSGPNDGTTGDEAAPALTRPVVALLPGSRTSEVQFLAEPLIRTAEWVAERCPEVVFVVPLVSDATRAQFVSALKTWGRAANVVLVEGQSRDCMAAADVVLLASGTATLEAMLLHRPMVITYKATALTYWIMERWMGANVRFAGLPNLLMNRLVVPELMQTKAVPEWLGPPVLHALTHPGQYDGLRQSFTNMHAELRANASERAADAIVGLLGPRLGAAI